MGKHFLWDPVEDNIVKEIDDSGSTIADYTTEPYLYGDLISQHRGGQSSFYHYDGQGSTTSLTDSAAIVADTYAYSAFGEVTARTGSTVNPFQYIGRSGYYCESYALEFMVRWRTLIAQRVRWLSQDPMHTPTDGSQYSYVANHPTSLIDPTGLQSVFGPGTATCGGVPSGAVFIPGRGEFTIASIGEFEKEGRFANVFPEVGSNFFAKWAPKPGAFVDANGCCCCDLIGYVQAVAESKSYYSVVSPWETVSFSPMPTNWRVDKGIPYPNSDMIKPCIPIGAPIDTRASHFTLRDNPGAPIRLRGVGTRLRFIKQDFYLCVVCLKGNEGISWRLGVGIWGLGWVAKGITVYGCIRWGHSIIYKGSPLVFQYKRFVYGNLSGKASYGDNKTSQADIRHDPGFAPPPSWWKAVKQYLY